MRPQPEQAGLRRTRPERRLLNPARWGEAEQARLAGQARLVGLVWRSEQVRQSEQRRRLEQTRPC